MAEWSTTEDDDRQAIERLLAAAAPRLEPPADVERQVRAALRAEWQDVVAATRARRRRVSLALAAAVAVVAVGAGLATSFLRGPPATVATVALAHGELRVTDGWPGRWHPVADGAVLRAGQRLASGPGTRGSLQWADGLSLRIDHATRVALRDAGHLEIEQGALYVDTGAVAARAGELRIGTPAGDVRHVGTQYEIRLAGREVIVRVREGAVEIRQHDHVLAAGRAGEQLTVDADGSVARHETATHGASWDWVAALAPAFDIDGQPLPEFLSWAGRELGLPVAYATPAVAAEAAGVLLSGSVAGLTPDQALQAVMETTRLRAVPDGERIVIRPGPDNG